VVSTERYGPPIVPTIATDDGEGGTIWICWRGYSRVVGFVGEHGAAADAAVVEAADLDAGVVVVGRSLLVDGLHGARQALYLRGPRLVRPRESCDPIRKYSLFLGVRENVQSVTWN